MYNGFLLLQYFADYKLGYEYVGMVTIYSASFLQYLGFAAQVPNVVFNWLNIFVQFGLVVRIFS